jgi:hypothetical protein
VEEEQGEVAPLREEQQENSDREAQSEQGEG